jgi:ABC-type amino acid transport substrate-binding protein
MFRKRLAVNAHGQLLCRTSRFSQHRRAAFCERRRFNTSEPVADELARTGRIASVRRYAYRDILTALDDVEAGRVGGFMKLEPVMRWLTRDRPTLAITQTGITHEDIGVAVQRDDSDLAGRIDRVLDELRSDGTLVRLGREWLGTDAPNTTTSVLS